MVLLRRGVDNVFYLPPTLRMMPGFNHQAGEILQSSMEVYSWEHHGTQWGWSKTL